MDSVESKILILRKDVNVLTVPMMDRADFLNTPLWDEIKFCPLVTQINLSHSL